MSGTTAPSVSNTSVVLSFETGTNGSYVTDTITGPVAESSLYRVKGAITSLLTGIFGGGNFSISSGGYGSTGDITYTGQPTDADTVTINGVVLTAKTTVATSNQFAIGADEDATYANLVVLINSTTTSNTLLKTVFAVQDTAAGKVYLYSRIPGTISNVSGGLYTLAESLNNATVTAFAGGTDGTTEVGVI